jgi:hypothetical protein
MVKVYDCILFNGEWDLLDLRLNLLNSVVDYFVITESIHTFMGKPKKLRFDFEDPRIDAFKSKIRYNIVADMPNQEVWANERWQRNSCTRALWDAEPEDLILISDCDELPRAESVHDAKHNKDYNLYGFVTTWYYCFMNNIGVNGHHPEISVVGVRFKELNGQTPDEFRWNIRGMKYPVGVYTTPGWHFSYLMTKEQIIEKIQNFSHQEFNTPSVLSKIDPIRSVREGKDLLGRDWITWKLVPIEEIDLPSYVAKNMHIYGKYFMRPEDAGAG